jgi:hypothetical protein
MGIYAHNYPGDVDAHRVTMSSPVKTMAEVSGLIRKVQRQVESQQYTLVHRGVPNTDMVPRMRCCKGEH